MAKATPINLDDAFAELTFLPDRTPETTDEAAAPAFGILSDYRDGAVFIAHYAGGSQWERHGNGDEVVIVLDGETTLFLLDGADERAHALRAGELLVVPQGAWHRFETPRGAKILTVTPQPTDHRLERPEP